MFFAEWLFGYVATKAGDRVRARLVGDPFLREMERVIDDWRSTLPDDARLDSARALFPSTNDEIEPALRPALLALRREIGSATIPDQKIWLQALLEQWRDVKQAIDQPQNFFNIAESEAQTHLQALSAKLVVLSAQYRHLFQPTVFALLLEISTAIEALRLPNASSAAAKGYPLTALAIEWTSVMRQVIPPFRRAMVEKLPWPGEYADLTDEEYRLYRTLKSCLLTRGAEQGEIVAAMDRLRSLETLEVKWNTQRDDLLDRIARIEAADG